MISRSETVVDKRTVVVELVNTSIANRAVETCFRFDYFIVYT
jgi:hypothetical protein